MRWDGTTDLVPEDFCSCGSAILNGSCSNPCCGNSQ